MDELQFKEYALLERKKSLERILDTKFDIYYLGGCLAAGAVGSWGLRWFFDQQYLGTNLPWVLLALVFAGLAIKHFSKERKNERQQIANMHNENIERMAKNYGYDIPMDSKIWEHEYETT